MTGLRQSVLDIVKKEYDKYRDLGVILTSNVCIVDFSLPAYEPRLFIININSNERLYTTYVAHGSGSNSEDKAFANRFSDEDGSHQSSLGAYVTKETYQGKHGLSRRVKGLEPTNKSAFPRSIVIHSASYIGNGQEGNSWGCFAVPMNAIMTVLSLLKPGSLLYAYYGGEND